MNGEARAMAAQTEDTSAANQAAPAPLAVAAFDELAVHTAAPTSAPVSAAAPAPAPALALAPAPAPAHLAPVVAAPAPAVAPIRIERYDLPTVDLGAMAASAGLEWVQSDADKIAAVHAAMAAEPAAIRLPREPRRPVLSDDGPLVLVETKKDLSQLKLPFEVRAG